ncbi:MAG TPA: alpha/beta hydrolase [bacterium]|nr:alpha/beta hydrolase [bacterium]HPN42756.1 alpha/beta hydrolase [bacterium]
MRLSILISVLVLLFCCVLNTLAGEPAERKLWPAGALLKNDQQVVDPYYLFYPADPAKNTGTAVVIFPGGGYWTVVMDREGSRIAEWLNTIGVNGIVVNYRRGPGSQHPVPLMDAQRAIRTVRYHAAEWGINPQRIGVMGFSAGGHLAATSGVHYDAGNSAAADPIERVSSRPDFMVLVYAVISMEEMYTHGGSLANLLGEKPGADLIKYLSLDTQITQDTPPTFLILSNEDTVVPAENSVLFYLGLRKAGVPAEMHIFAPGKHGFDLGLGDPVLSVWPELCKNWLAWQGLLK